MSTSGYSYDIALFWELMAFISCIDNDHLVVRLLNEMQIFCWYI
jgi:hypothetical protein